MNEVNVTYTRWGLANRFPDGIELNQVLKKNPRLHDSILHHELGHKKDNTFKQDYVHDLRPINKLSQKDLIIFMVKHPTTWTQLLPFYYSPKRKKIIYDLNMVINYSLVIGFIGLAFYLAIR